MCARQLSAVFRRGIEATLRCVISKSTFWAVSLAQIGIAVAAGYVARERGLDAARLRQEVQTAAAKNDADKRLCGVEKTQAETKANQAATHAKEADAREAATRQQLVAWQSAGNRAGIVAWLGTHANCVGRAVDGRCNKYKLPEGAVLETDAPAGPASARVQ
jgi:hypothetical protein